MKIRELLTLPPIKTVVQLSDTRDSAERTRLVDQFVLTDEVRRGLRIILDSVLRSEGRGFFLKGHYGSGKSHFLCYLSLILSNPESLSVFLKRLDQTRPGLAEGKAALPPPVGLANKRVAVVTLSLVEHRSTRRLEDIVMEALAPWVPAEADTHKARPDVADGAWEELLKPYRNELKAFLNRNGLDYRSFRASPELLGAFADEVGLGETSLNRREFFEQVFERLRDQGYEGLVLLIDELSEFLRSKLSVRHFNEDIRYLQFLGELSSGRPLWIVAALQEFIEETGEINQELFNKIKDRYPLRLTLTAEHVKSLVREIIVRKKPEAAAVVAEVYARLKAAFPDLPIARDEFVELYPVHPASIDLLELLKPLFSKTRGFIDFVHYQVKGDPDRGIRGMLDEPPEALLCPDRIFDHFLDRMRGTLEILPYIETVFAYYQKEIPRIFESPEDQRYAFRLVKLLILQDICPTRQEFSVRQLTEMLLERVTDLDPEANYAYTHDIAEELMQKGGFLSHAVAPDRLEDVMSQVYHVRLEADVGPAVNRKVQYRTETLRPLGRQLEYRLFRHLIPRSDFFSDLNTESSWLLAVDWQNTRRFGTVYIPGDGSILPKPDPGEERQDFDLVVLLPGQSPDSIGDLLEKLGGGTAILQPYAVPDLGACAGVLALFEILHEMEDDESAQGRRFQERLEALLKDRLPAVLEMFQRSFQNAQLITPQGELLFAFEPGPRARWVELLQEAGSVLLEHRFPQHYLIAPQQSYYPQAALEELPAYFQGMTSEAFERLRWGRTVLEGFLLPTGIVRRHRREYTFATRIEDSKPLTVLLELASAGQGVSAARAFEAVAESPFGMSELQFKPFLLAAIHAGFVMEYRKGRKVSLQNIQASRLMEIQELRPGATVGAAVLQVLQYLDWIPRKFKKPSLSHSECQECWERIRDFNVEAGRKKLEVEHLIRRYREYKAFDQVNEESAQQALLAVGRLLEGIKTSYGAVEGLEGFAASVSAPDEVNRAVRALDSWHLFLSEHFAAFVSIVNYTENVAELVDSPAYPELRSALDRLRLQLRNWDPAYSEQLFPSLKADFDEWLNSYITTYSGEHEVFHSSPLYKDARAVLDSDAFQVLQRLELLKFFVPDLRTQSIAAKGTSILEKQCHRSVWEELQQRPVCACGFRLGQQLSREGGERIRREVDSQLQQFVRQVRHPRVQELLDRFVFHTARLSKQTAGPAAVARRLKAVESVDQLLEFADDLTVDFIERLNRFEPERQPFRVKYMSDFFRSIGHEPKPGAALVRSFEQWLVEDGADPEQPIRLMSKAPEREEDARGVSASLVSTYAPELRADLERLTSEEFFFRLFAAWLGSRHGISIDRVAEHLPLSPSPELVEPYLRLAEAVQRQLGFSRDRIERFEERLGATEYEALGLLPDDPMRLAGVVAREDFFLSLSRLAFGRLLKRMTHGDLRALERVKKLLEEEWTTGADTAASELRRQQKDLLESYLWVRESEQRFKTAESKTVPIAGRFPKAAQQFYCESASLIPFRVSQLQVYREQLGVRQELDPAGAVEAATEGLRGFLENYERGILGAEDQLPRVETAIKRGLDRLVMDRPFGSKRLIFVDSMAWPLWKLLEERLNRALPPNVQILGAEPAYARTPSVTAEQVKHWMDTELLQDNSRTLPGRLPLIPGSPTETSYTIDWIDSKVHTSREDLFVLYTEILDQLQPQLVSSLSSLSGGTLAVLFADHGFTENPAYQPKEKYKHPRYRHGGSSPFELVVPVVFFYCASK